MYLHILKCLTMMLPFFHLPYFHISNNVLLFSKYSGTLIYIDVVFTLYISTVCTDYRVLCNTWTWFDHLDIRDAYLNVIKWQQFHSTDERNVVFYLCRELLKPMSSAKIKNEWQNYSMIKLKSSSYYVFERWQLDRTHHKPNTCSAFNKHAWDGGMRHSVKLLYNCHCKPTNSQWFNGTCNLYHWKPWTNHFKKKWWNESCIFFNIFASHLNQSRFPSSQYKGKATVRNKPIQARYCCVVL